MKSMLGLRRRGRVEKPETVEKVSTVSTSAASATGGDEPGGFPESGLANEKDYSGKFSTASESGESTTGESSDVMSRLRRRTLRMRMRLVAMWMLACFVFPAAWMSTQLPLFTYLKLFTRTRFFVPVDFVPVGDDHSLVATTVIPSDRFYHVKSISAILHVELPESETNFAANSFKVFMDVETLDGQCVGEFASVGSLKYRSPPVRFLRAVFFFPTFLSGYFSEYQQVQLRLFERRKFELSSPPQKTVGVLKVIPAEVRISKAYLEIRIHRRFFPIISMFEFPFYTFVGTIIVWVVYLIGILISSLIIKYVLRSYIGPYLDFYYEPSFSTGAPLILPFYLVLPAKLLISAIQSLITAKSSTLQTYPS